MQAERFAGEKAGAEEVEGLREVLLLKVEEGVGGGWLVHWGWGFASGNYLFTT
jgi:hypothetical protein